MANQRTFLRPLNCLALFLVLCLGPLCFGESVVVQVLNGMDGTPVRDQFVTMQLRNASAKTVMALNSRTDSNGKAHFLLPQTTPESLNVEVQLSAPALHCTCQTLVKTEAVIREGLVVSRRIRNSRLSAPIQPAPGHIVFVARPSSLLEKVLFDY
jgi:hypothetical protein